MSCQMQFWHDILLVKYMSLKEILDSAAERINCTDFIAADPVQFPHRFCDKRDIEITSILISTIAWGKRQMILRDGNRLLDLLGNDPYNFIKDGDICAINSEQNIHRTFFGRDLKYFLNGLRKLYAEYGTLEDFAHKCGATIDDYPAWKLVEALNAVFSVANEGLFQSTRCLPGNLKNTPLKRINMALRWLVRNDGIVDLGVWTALKPSQLFIPLDVHVGNTSRRLGLLLRNANDKKSAIEITEKLREFDFSDPIKYDFALFGLGIEGSEE